MKASGARGEVGDGGQAGGEGCSGRDREGSAGVLEGKVVRALRGKRVRGPRAFATRLSSAGPPRAAPPSKSRVPLAFAIPREPKRPFPLARKPVTQLVSRSMTVPNGFRPRPQPGLWFECCGPSLHRVSIGQSPRTFWPCARRRRPEDGGLRMLHYNLDGGKEKPIRKP